MEESNLQQQFQGQLIHLSLRPKLRRSQSTTMVVETHFNTLIVFIQK